MKNLTAEPICDLGKMVLASWEILAADIDAAGAVTAIARQSREPLVKNGFSKTHHAEPTPLRIFLFKNDQTREVQIDGEKIIPHFVRAVGDDFLIVCARCDFRDGDPEKNAILVDKNGAVRRRFCLGDGITDLLVTPDREILVGYFDEGIFGARGWGDDPVGRSGFVKFNFSGEKIWEFDAEKIGTGPIDSLEILNFDESGTWIYFLGDFSIVNLDGEKSRVWKTPTALADAIAIDGDRALIFGGFLKSVDEKNSQKINGGEIFHLGKNGRAKKIDEVQIQNPTGEKIAFDRIFARGRNIFLLGENDVWYRVGSW